MPKANAQNARIKREYFHYLKEARRRDELSIGVQTGPPIGAQKGPPFTMAQG